MLIFDKSNLESKREKSPEGFLLVKDNKIARTGILIYGANEISPKGIPKHEKNRPIRVYRDPSTLLAEDTMRTFEGKPFVVTHPGLVDSKNVTKVISGTLYNVRAEDGAMIGDIVIHDATAVKAVEDGKMVELSLGYNCSCRWAPGVTQDGQAYDAIFENYQGNHVALVPAGRCGSDCRIADAKPKENEMKKVKIGDAEFELVGDNAEAIQSAFDAAIADASNKRQKEAKMDKCKTDGDDKDEDDKDEEKKKEGMKQDAELQKLQAKFDSAQEEIESLKKKIEDKPVQDAASLDQLVEDRANLVVEAKKILGSAYEFKGKSKIQLMQDACLKHTGKDMSGKSEDYIQSRFDTIMEQIADGTAKVFKDVASAAAKEEPKMSLSERKRQEFIETKGK